MLVDAHERYPYRFATQQVTVRRRGLPAGDYAVAIGDRIVAAVERKGLEDLSSPLLSGSLRFQLAELASLPRAAVVVEERFSAVFKLEHVRHATVADGLAEAQVRWPAVPILFLETRALAEEWTYRWLAAALSAAQDDDLAAERLDDLVVAPPLTPTEPTTAEVRAWALAAGLPVSDRGRLRPEVWAAYSASEG